MAQPFAFYLRRNPARPAPDLADRADLRATTVAIMIFTMLLSGTLAALRWRNTIFDDRQSPSPPVKVSLTSMSSRA